MSASDSTADRPAHRSTHRRARGRLAVAATGLAVAVIAAGACSSDETPARRSTTTTPPTSIAAPSTVDDADFDSQATTAELMIRNAGSDPCAVITAFSPASSLPTPVNATQTERGVGVVVQLFRAANASAPPEAAGDAQVLSKAADDLLAEGAAKGWNPAWLIAVPASISNPTVTRAFANYQSAVRKHCSASTPTTAPGG